MSSADLPFRHAVRVYWEDTDAGGIVYYANYLKFFERARTEWLRRRGVHQQAMREAHGVVFVVADATVRYLRPARLDDQLDISVEPGEQGLASMSLVQCAWRGVELLARGQVRIGCVDAATLKPVRFPTSLQDLLR